MYSSLSNTTNLSDFSASGFVDFSNCLLTGFPLDEETLTLEDDTADIHYGKLRIKKLGVDTIEIKDLAVTNAKILSMDADKLTGNIEINAGQIGMSLPLYLGVNNIRSVGDIESCRDIVPAADDVYELGNILYRWKSVYSRDGLFDGSVSTPIVDHSLGVVIAYAGQPRIHTTFSGISLLANTILDGNMTIGGLLYPTLDNTYSLGLNTNRFSTLYTVNIDSSSGTTLRFNTSPRLITRATDTYVPNSLTIAGSLLPITDAAHDIGSGSLRWSTLNCQYINDPFGLVLQYDGDGRVTLRSGDVQVNCPIFGRDLLSQGNGLYDIGMRVLPYRKAYANALECNSYDSASGTYSFLSGGAGRLTVSAAGVALISNVSIGGDVIPDLTGYSSIGSATRELSYVYTQNIRAASTIDMRIGTTSQLTVSSTGLAATVPITAGTNSVTCGSVITPTIAATGDLRLQQGGVDRLFLETTKVRIGSTLHPTGANIYDCGANGAEWKSGWINTLNCPVVTSTSGVRIQYAGSDRVITSSTGTTISGNLAAGAISTGTSSITCGSVVTNNIATVGESRLNINYGTSPASYLSAIGPSLLKNKKVVLFDNNTASDTQYSGFGIQGGTLVYATNRQGATHRFYTGDQSSVGGVPYSGLFECFSIGYDTNINAYRQVNLNGNRLLAGPIQHAVTALSANLTLDYTIHSVIAVNSSAATRTITLPAGASGNIGASFIIKCTTGTCSRNPIVVVTTSGNTIDTRSRLVIRTNFAAVTLMLTSATNWSIM